MRIKLNLDRIKEQTLNHSTCIVSCEVTKLQKHEDLVTLQQVKSGESAELQQICSPAQLSPPLNIWMKRQLFQGYISSFRVSTGL